MTSNKNIKKKSKSSSTSDLQTLSNKSSQTKKFSKQKSTQTMPIVQNSTLVTSLRKINKRFLADIGKLKAESKLLHKFIESDPALKHRFEAFKTEQENVDLQKLNT